MKTVNKQFLHSAKTEVQFHGFGDFIIIECVLETGDVTNVKGTKLHNAC